MISIIGAGNVGSSAALKIASENITDIVLVDITEGIPQGKALDIMQAMPIYGSNSKVVGTNDFSAIKDSEIVVITAGVPRKPGMSRSDLLDTNKKIMTSVCENIKKYAPNAIVIVVTNPLDAMCYAAYKILGFDKKKVIGMAGVLDSIRFRAFISEKLKVDVNKVEAMVLGSHGDSMVPLAQHIKVDGKPIGELTEKETVNALVERTRKAGGEIVSHLKTGSAYYAPGAAIARMVENILKDNNEILPCSCYLEGEYGLNGVYIGVPCKLGKEGLKEVVELELTDDEKDLFSESAEEARKLQSELDL